MQVKSFWLCGSDFWITAVGDITNGITWAVFCFHKAHISFASSWYLFITIIIIIIILGISFMQGISLKETMSLGNTVLQLFWCNYSWCVYC